MQANGTDRYLEIYIVQFLVGKSNEGGKIVRSEITLERGQIVSAFSWEHLFIYFIFLFCASSLFRRPTTHHTISTHSD